MHMFDFRLIYKSAEGQNPFFVYENRRRLVDQWPRAEREAKKKRPVNQLPRAKLQAKKRITVHQSPKRSERLRREICTQIVDLLYTLKKPWNFTIFSVYKKVFE